MVAGRMVPRRRAWICIVGCMLCVLAMASYTDCAIKKAGQLAREAASRAAAAVAEAGKAKEKYMQQLEELGSCAHGK